VFEIFGAERATHADFIEASRRVLKDAENERKRATCAANEFAGNLNCKIEKNFIGDEREIILRAECRELVFAPRLWRSGRGIVGMNDDGGASARVMARSKEEKSSCQPWS